MPILHEYQETAKSQPPKMVFTIFLQCLFIIIFGNSVDLVKQAEHTLHRLRGSKVKQWDWIILP